MLRDPNEPTWERYEELWVGNCKHTFILSLIGIVEEGKRWLFGSLWIARALPVYGIHTVRMFMFMTRLAACFGINNTAAPPQG